MLKNKKNVSIIAIVLIAIIGLVYAGCSKSADMQTTPDTNQVMSTMENTTDEDCNCCEGYEFKYLTCSCNPEVLDIDTDDFVLLNPGVQDLLVWTADSIEDSEENYFFNSEVKSAFIAKLRVAANLIDEGKKKAALNKLNNDLLDKVEKWVLEEYRASAGSIIETVIYGVESNNHIYVSSNMVPPGMEDVWQSSPVSPFKMICTGAYTGMDKEGNTYEYYDCYYDAFQRIW